MRNRRVELDDLQGNVLRAYRFPVAQHLFVEMHDPVAARRWLAGLVPRVTPGSPWTGSGPAATTNVAFTYSGLAALGVGADVLASFPRAFREGMAARADLLGDIGPSEPDRWVPGLGSNRAHVLIMTYGRDDDALADSVAEVRSGVDATEGATVVHQRDAYHLPGAREHFGFDDGFAQPAVASVHGDPSARGIRSRFGWWRPLPVGEFVLGYRDAEGFLPPAPRGSLGRNATFLVYREYAQDVAAFRAFTAAAAAQIERDEEWVAARMIGRWRDGTPLALSPDHPDPAISGDPVQINDFDHGDDPSGLRCPLGAHTRRANPRDGIPFGAHVTRRHRIIRRGMPYGPPLPADATGDDGQDRGLVFLCFNADLVRQFEFIQREWVLDGNVFGLGNDHDPLLGNSTGTAKMTIPGEPPSFLSPLRPFVTVRGGEYLFVPGRRGLAALVEGTLSR